MDGCNDLSHSEHEHKIKEEFRETCATVVVHAKNSSEEACKASGHVGFGKLPWSTEFSDDLVEHL